MRLSKRLKKILSLIEYSDLLVDIGTDHAYIPIEAVLSGKAKRAAAVDINNNVISEAAKRIESLGLSESIDVIRSDGFKDIPHMPIDTVLICGMGGELIAGILSDACQSGFPLDKVKTFILSPQSEPHKLRRFIIDTLGLCIDSESYVAENGKYYIIIKAVNDDKREDYSEADYLYGKDIDQSTIDTYIAYLKYRLKSAENALKKVREGRNGI